MIFFKILGIEIAKYKFRKMPVKIQKKVLRAVARAGAGIIRTQYRRNLKQHRRTGSLEKSVGVIVRAYPSTGDVVGYAGIRRDKRFNGGPSLGDIKPGKYNHLVEAGRKAFMRKWFRKRPPTPFADGKPRFVPAAAGAFPLKQAIETTKEKVKTKLMEVFFKNLNKEAAKISGNT